MTTLFLPSLCQSAETSRELSSIELRLIEEIFELASANARANPAFRIHTMGMNINEDIGKNIRTDTRLVEILKLTRGMAWELVPAELQVKFRELVDEDVKRRRVDAEKLSMRDIWEEVSSNTHIRSTCCGGFCRFQVSVDGTTEAVRRGWVSLDYFPNLKGHEGIPTCILSWHFPEYMTKDLPATERISIARGTHVTFEDENCDGTFGFRTQTTIPIPVVEPPKEWRTRMESVSKQFIQSFNPIQHGKQFQGKGCDL